ncbi:MAG: DUF2087 domain-containing protein [Mycobacteriales bacterium]
MTALWGLLADDERRRVFAALSLGDRTLSAIADRAELALPRAVRALERLEKGGVVLRDDDDWVLDAGNIAERARADSQAPEPYVEAGLDPTTAAVLRAFLRDGRLTRIPAVRSKRVVVLDHIAKVFEIGVRYPEREVDALVRAFHPDFAALRRYLVDEGFLAREAGIYWRTGGTVEL